MIVKDSKVLLEVRGLCASVNGTEVLRGVDLTVRYGEVHAIMGPNGSGKSTFSKVLAGHKAYEITGGSVLFEGKDLFALEPEERARGRLFSVSISDRNTGCGQRTVFASRIQHPANSARS